MYYPNLWVTEVGTKPSTQRILTEPMPMALSFVMFVFFRLGQAYELASLLLIQLDYGLY